MENAEIRTRFFGMTVSQRDAFMARAEVKDFVERLRRFKGNERSVTGSTLGIPEVMLDILRDNIDRYSKLMKYVTLKQVRGTARQPIAGTVPEAIWMEAVSNLNDIDFVFTQVEADGYKVGGFIAIPNSTLEDDIGIDLMQTVMDMMGQAIGYAVDKALPYGTGTKMPVGWVTRLAASSQPSWWGTNQGTFTDLHTSHVLTLNISSNTGAAFFQPLLAALGVADPRYSNGVPCWVMNRKNAHRPDQPLPGFRFQCRAAGRHAEHDARHRRPISWNWILCPTMRSRAASLAWSSWSSAPVRTSGPAISR